MFFLCVFIESSVSHISLEGWNNLSGTVFPRVLYLTYLFVLSLFFWIILLCVFVCRHSPPDLQNVCTSDFSVLLQIEVNAIKLHTP